MSYSHSDYTKLLEKSSPSNSIGKNSFIIQFHISCSSYLMLCFVDKIFLMIYSDLIMFPSQYGDILQCIYYMTLIKWHIWNTFYHFPETDTCCRETVGSTPQKSYLEKSPESSGWRNVQCFRIKEEANMLFLTVAAISFDVCYDGKFGELRESGPRRNNNQTGVLWCLQGNQDSGLQDLQCSDRRTCTRWMDFKQGRKEKVAMLI